MIACVRVHYFPAAVERRDNSKLTKKPLVIGGQHWSVNPVYATSAETAQLGVYRGLPLREAHALAPRATFLPSAQRKYQQTLTTVDELLNQFAGISEPLWTYPAAIDYLPCDDQRVSLLQQYGAIIGRTVREQIGLPASIGIGHNKFVAYMAAKLTDPHHLRVIETTPQAFLAPVLLTALSIDSILRERLALFGITTLGQLAALPAHAVREQFGTRGATLHQLAMGVDHRNVVNPPRELVTTRSFPFDDPIVDLQILVHVVGQLSADLQTQLITHNRAAQAVSLVIELEDGTRLTPNSYLRQPTQDGDRLTRQLTRLLQRGRYRAGVVHIGVTFSRLQPVEVKQLSLFNFTQVAKRETLEEVVAELTEKYESKLFLYGAPQQLESRLPERRWKWRKLAGSKNTAFHEVATDQIVPLHDEEDDAFCGFYWQGKRHDIERVTKLWRVDTAWWEAHAQRDYYKVRTLTGWLVAICYDYDLDKWFIHRVYD